MSKIIPPQGIVPLNEKQIPICECQQYIKQNAPDGEIFAFTRAVLDISALKAMLLRLPEEIWKDEYQSKQNVRIVRQGHDAWGINKIVFNFCDDFLLKVLDLPFSQQEDWQQLLRPVYAAVGADESRVVRSLFARMPPGATIPVHHDTGYWVKHTHRCHLPIVTAEDVHFFVGPTNDKMAEYQFDEGRLVELNNQAKHSVTNATSDVYRIHLIFDYVDDHPIHIRHKLQKGEVLYQTRRSIDLAREASLMEPRRKHPSFIILGAQKCGTTSMYEFICQHPLVVRGKCRETHYFDWRYNSAIATNDVEGHYKSYMQYFLEKALEKHLSLATGESTPSYLLHSDIVIPRMKKVCPSVRLIVMLRNPVDRAYSQYQMFIDPVGTPDQLKMRAQSKYKNSSFEKIVDEEIEELETLGITPDSHHSDFITRYLNKADSPLPMGNGGHSIVARGLYVFQLAHWMEEFGGSCIKVMSIGDIKSKSPSELQQLMEEVFAHIGLPPSDVGDLAAKNTRNYSHQPMQEDIKSKLQRFYAPFNERLFALLNRTITNW